MLTAKIKRGTYIHFQFVGERTTEDVLEAANNYLLPQNMVIVIVGNAEEIKPQVENLGTVEIIDDLKILNN